MPGVAEESDCSANRTLRAVVISACSHVPAVWPGVAGSGVEVVAGCGSMKVEAWKNQVSSSGGKWQRSYLLLLRDDVYFITVIGVIIIITAVIGAIFRKFCAPVGVLRAFGHGP